MGDKTVKGLEPKKLNGKGLNIMIVHTRWNNKVVDALVQGAVDELAALGVASITKADVPGAFELPLAVQHQLSIKDGQKYRYDAVIAIGVLIKGSTMHFEYIAEATANGLMRVGILLNSGLDQKRPVIFGVLTCLTDQQALQRAGIGHCAHNHGIDWAQAAVEMSLLTKAPN